MPYIPHNQPKLILFQPNTYTYLSPTLYTTLYTTYPPQLTLITTLILTPYPHFYTYIPHITHSKYPPRNITLTNIKNHINKNHNTK